jgi:hypothetical protein
MAAADVVGRVREVAARAAGTYGLDVFDVQYRRGGRHGPRSDRRFAGGEAESL